MGTRILFFMILPVLICALVGVAQAWQGRMGGMEDPYGLVQDESDFLIHPAKIVDGEGIKFYGDYSLNYTNVTDWEHRVDEFTPGGVWSGFFQDKISGEEFRHNALAGAAFPLGTGRMGLFFTYEGMKADNYEGHYSDSLSEYWTLDMKHDLDNFALRLLYGLPIGAGFKLGAEAQIAYCQEQEWNVNIVSAANTEVLNSYLMNPSSTAYPAFAYMWPYNSKYWEALFKGSMDRKVGPLDVELTLKGGFDFNGTNKWDYEVQLPVGTPFAGWDTRGDVKGWQVGEDLWLRYTLAQDLTLPLLLRVDYRQITRDGSGPGWGSGFVGNYYDYSDEAKDLLITVGGGVDKAIGKDTSIAAGIYYNYLRGTDDWSLNTITPTTWEVLAYTFPDSTEYQVLLRLTGEHAFSPVVALRAGLSFFYGWVTPKESVTYNTSSGTSDIVEGSGHSCPHWGIGASLGGTINVKPLTLEPFVAGGYQQLHQRWSTEGYTSGVLTNLFDEKFLRNDWNAGMGLSILFNL